MWITTRCANVMMHKTTTVLWEDQRYFLLYGDSSVLTTLKWTPNGWVQRGGRPDCETIALSGGSALQEFFNFLLLNNSALVRSLDNILHGTVWSAQSIGQMQGKHNLIILILYHWSRTWWPSVTELTGMRSSAVIQDQWCHALTPTPPQPVYKWLFYPQAFYELMVINRNDSAIFYWGNKENSQKQNEVSGKCFTVGASTSRPPGLRSWFLLSIFPPLTSTLLPSPLFRVK